LLPAPARNASAARNAGQASRPRRGPDYWADDWGLRRCQSHRRDVRASHLHPISPVRGVGVVWRTSTIRRSRIAKDVDVDRDGRRLSGCGVGARQGRHGRRTANTLGPREWGGIAAGSGRPSVAKVLCGEDEKETLAKVASRARVAASDSIQSRPNALVNERSQVGKPGTCWAQTQQSMMSMLG